TVKGRRGSYELDIPLLGEYQMENAAAAVAALEVLAERGVNLPEESLVRGMKEVDWPGRLQILGRHPRLVVDGAHNVDSARRLRQALEQYLDFERATLIIGFSYDKDMAGIVAALAPLFGRVIVTRSRHPRAAATGAIAAEFARHGRPAEIAESVPAALTSALAQAGDRDLVCATGSLFVVAEVLEEVAPAGPPPGMKPAGLDRPAIRQWCHTG
ncbi:MAG: cyanophycin synthetase, partial [Chloroflexota bacterium]